MLKIGGSSLKYIAVAAVIVEVGVWALQPKAPTDSASEQTVNVKVPALSAQAADGKEAFDANCAACHGRNAAGTKNGPTLVHDIYNPGHHSDDAFLFAVMQACLGIIGHTVTCRRSLRSRLSNLQRSCGMCESSRLQTAYGIIRIKCDDQGSHTPDHRTECSEGRLRWRRSPHGV